MLKTRQLQKKIKRLQENHAKSKQDYALKVFALKDEKARLIEENEALEGDIARFPFGDFFSGEQAKSNCDWLVMSSVFVTS